MGNGVFALLTLFRRIFLDGGFILYTIQFAYTAVALLFAGFCIREYLDSRPCRRWDVYRTIGLVACAAWPLMLVFVIFEARAVQNDPFQRGK